MSSGLNDAPAREAIAALRLTPVFFEAGARPYPPRELYQAYVAQSDIFIGIYWQRYGWVAPAMDISALEEESDCRKVKHDSFMSSVPRRSANHSCSNSSIASAMRVPPRIRSSRRQPISITCWQTTLPSC